FNFNHGWTRMDTDKGKGVTRISRIDTNFGLGQACRIIAFAFFLLCLVAFASAEPAADSVVREQLVKTLLSEGAEQQTNLTQLADTGSKLARDVLTAWTRDGVYIYETNGAKTPILLEEQSDATGKARAIQIVDGQFLKDDKGRELRF